MWIDITMPLHRYLAIWPGDTPFQYRLDATMQQDGANVGQIQMSVHAGTHVDAPFHYDDFGKSVESLPIDLFIGEVLIVHCVGRSKVDVGIMRTLPIKNERRVFFKTKEIYNETVFDENFTPLTEEAVHYLADLGIQLIGTDAPSIDPLNAELSAHHACRERGVTIIENLYLKDVEQGYYEFIGVPLPIQGGDASPIRAVIRKSIR